MIVELFIPDTGDELLIRFVLGSMVEFECPAEPIDGHDAHRNPAGVVVVEPSGECLEIGSLGFFGQCDHGVGDARGIFCE